MKHYENLLANHNGFAETQTGFDTQPKSKGSTPKMKKTDIQLKEKECSSCNGG